MLIILSILGFSMVWCYAEPLRYLRRLVLSPEICEKVECLPCSSFWIGIVLTLTTSVILWQVGVVSLLAYIYDKHFNKTTMI